MNRSNLVVDLEAERQEGKVQVEINLLIPHWVQALLHTAGLVKQLAVLKIFHSSDLVKKERQFSPGISWCKDRWCLPCPWPPACVPHTASVCSEHVCQHSKQLSGLLVKLHFVVSDYFCLNLFCILLIKLFSVSCEVWPSLRSYSLTNPPLPVFFVWLRPLLSALCR